MPARRSSTAPRRFRARAPSKAPRGRPAQLRSAARHIEARLWTGRSAHLVGGTLDLLQALARYALARRAREAAR
ncbi:MAG TPA: hypothetical protein VHY83_00190 [Solirubrobacteraceae bacterium]|nr:hypothetical protein [Solirubrobacteraceae bacterium]